MWLLNLMGEVGIGMTEILLIIQTVLLILFGLFFRHIKSYMTEKGKNLAQKEDIQEITGLVEGVRSDFKRETETLKSRLSVLSGTQLNLINEERNAIIEFIKGYYEWYGEISEFSTPSTDNSEIEKSEEKIHEARSRCIASEAMFEMFVNDDELFLIKIEQYKATLNELSAAIILFGKYKETNVKLKLIVLKGKSGVLTDDDAEQYKTLLREGNEEFRKYQDERVERYKVLGPIQTAFKAKCRERLYKLIEEGEQDAE